MRRKGQKKLVNNQRTSGAIEDKWDKVRNKQRQNARRNINWDSAQSVHGKYGVAHGNV